MKRKFRGILLATAAAGLTMIVSGAVAPASAMSLQEAVSMAISTNPSVGQQATVKFDTYDYSIYGGLKATVEYISIDAIEDQSSGKKERYFRVRLRTEKNYLGTEAKPLAIGPGYTATAEILTDKKTVLAYLMKPILKARDTALRER